VMLVSFAVEGYSLVRFGEPKGMFGFVVHVPAALAIRYEASYFCLSLLVIFLGARIIQWIAVSFDSRPSYWNCLMAVSYGLAPFYLLRLLDAIPTLNTWICYALGILCTTGSLYHGIPRALILDQTKAFGTFLLGVLVMVFLTISVHFVCVSILQRNVLI
jgi:Yip1 domain